MSVDHCRGALLTMGTYCGTLAAARDLGRAGIHVALADKEAGSHTAKSRFVSSYFTTPDLRSLEAYAEWLIAFGQMRPGFVLYPTSDDLAWIIARYQTELRKYYFLYQPSEKSIYGLLNKESLTKTARSLGIATPRTWFPRSLQEVEVLSQELTYPVLVKPKTQIGLSVQVKGIIAQNPAQLLEGFMSYKRRYPYKPELERYDPSLAMVMIQDFFPSASHFICSLSGFIDDQHEHSAFRSSVKILQRPIQCGVGIGFESRAVNPHLQTQILKLAKEVGYFGVFEAEFLCDPDTGEHFLIDFNPRFYGQMAFEISRKLPLARLAYAGALGDRETIRALIEESRSWDEETPVKGLLKLPLALLVTTQWLGGRMSRLRRRQWLQWAQRGVVCDLLHDPHDPHPSQVESRQILFGMLRHPRSFLSTYFR